MPTTLTATRSQAFKGNLLIKDLFISNPFEADPTSSYNATTSVIVIDEDHLDETPKRCQIEWKAGVSTPDSAQHQCENNTLRVWFPKNTFRGVGNFQMQLAHTTIDTEQVKSPLV
ncbi:hypothetical protein LTS08_001826 [Lithohypha guttulata]|nr:hypothetical protein LTS08_001826 [Lithohypha guttulata]